MPNQVIDMASSDGKSYARKRRAYRIGQGQVTPRNGADINAVVDFGYDADRDTVVALVTICTLASQACVRCHVDVPLGPIRREVVLAMHQSILGQHELVLGQYASMPKYIRKVADSAVSQVAGKRAIGVVSRIVNNPKFQKDVKARVVQPSPAAKQVVKQARHVVSGVFVGDEEAGQTARNTYQAAREGNPKARIAADAMTLIAADVTENAQTAEELWQLSGWEVAL